MIKARIRSEGRDMDEHVEEFLREWMEDRPESASLTGFIRKNSNLVGKNIFHRTCKIVARPALQ